MNQEQIQKALSLQNTAHVSEATRIAPHILQNIIDGKYIPNPEEIDALAGWFGGEYFMSGTDFNWTRKRRVEEPVATLSTIGSYIDPATLPPRGFARWASPADYPALPALKPGPAPTGNGAGPNNQGITGTGRQVR